MIDWSAITPEQMSDKRWRLEHLYMIQDKAGCRVPFRLWSEQRELLDGFAPEERDFEGSAARDVPSSEHPCALRGSVMANDVGTEAGR